MANTIDLDSCVDEFVESHAHACKSTGGSASQVSTAQAKVTLAEVVKRLRSLNINWTQILQFIGPILSLVFAGTPVGSIITAILALLNPAPTPAPSINPA